MVSAHTLEVSVQRIRVEEACRKVSLRQREGAIADSHISVTRRERLPTISGEGIRIQDLPLPPQSPTCFVRTEQEVLQPPKVAPPG